MARVTGAGNSSTNHSYTYTDKNPFKGISYYRLKQTDYNGKSETFKIVPVTIAQKANEIETIRFSPNPFHDWFMLEFNSPGTEALVQIISYNGAVAYSETIKAEKGYNAFRFSIPPGLKAANYILKITGGNNLLATKRISYN